MRSFHRRSECAKVNIEKGSSRNEFCSVVTNTAALCLRATRFVV